jgi:hypothetical protein
MATLGRIKRQSSVYGDKAHEHHRGYQIIVSGTSDVVDTQDIDVAGYTSSLIELFGGGVEVISGTVDIGDSIKFQVIHPNGTDVIATYVNGRRIAPAPSVIDITSVDEAAIPSSFKLRVTVVRVSGASNSYTLSYWYKYRVIES